MSSVTNPQAAAIQAVTAMQLQTALQTALQPSFLQVIDESGQHIGHAGANGLGYGTHFRVCIAAPVFTDRSRVACHRLVYDALLPFMSQGVHALAIEICQ